jgi:hypothetical protein
VVFLIIPEQSGYDSRGEQHQSDETSMQAYLEAEVGREIRFVLMNSEELLRLNMLDRFFIEFLEGPYEEVTNKVPELKRFISG